MTSSNAGDNKQPSYMPETIHAAPVEAQRVHQMSYSSLQCSRSSHIHLCNPHTLHTRCTRWRMLQHRHTQLPPMLHEGILCCWQWGCGHSAFGLLHRFDDDECSLQRMPGQRVPQLHLAQMQVHVH